MNESAVIKGYPHLEYLHEKREGLGQKELNVALLRSQAGSQDPQISIRAQEQLRIKWDLDPGKDAQNAKTVDIMEQLEAFTKPEKEIMLPQSAGIQLTEGCNGNCPFCLFGEKKKGVEAKYSFGSLVRFFHEYDNLLPEGVALYWNSDPFDWRDGEHNFTDIYKAWRKIRPAEFQFVSTAIPRGGEDDFIDFMRNAAAEQYGRESGDPNLSLKVRISLAQHNIQRVETTLNKLTETLLKDSYTQSEINDFYDACLEIAEKFESSQISQIGQLIKKHDDIKDIYTPACRDGIVFTPKSSKATMITAPTIYEPSGEKDAIISPGQVENQTPLLRKILGDRGLDTEDSLIVKANSGEAMLGIIKTSNGKEYELPDKTENVVLKLGREAASIGRLIIDLAAFSPPTPATIQKLILERQGYLNTVSQTFRDRQIHTQKQLTQAKEFLGGGILSAADSEKIQFYVLLTETYLAKMDFLADQIEEGQSIKTISWMAEILRSVGKERLPELPKMMEILPGWGRKLEAKESPQQPVHSK